MLTQAPPQSVRTPGQPPPMQVPPAQTWPSAQRTPHAPQLVGSAAVFRHARPHWVSVGGHPQLPLMQI